MHGKADTAPVLLSALEAGAGGFVVTSDPSYAAQMLAGGRDIDGDGLDDVVLGSQTAATSFGSFGRASVVYGKADTAPVELDAVAIGDGGFVIEAETNASAADAVGLADVNGDLLADVLVGVGNPLSGPPYAGRTYVVSGVSTAPHR